MPREIRTIQQFYALMQESAQLRRRVVAGILEGAKPDREDCERLGSCLEALRRIPRRDGRYALSAESPGAGPNGAAAGRRTVGRRELFLELDYEIGELEKDRIYLLEGEKALLGHFGRIHPGFQEQLDDALEFCSGMSLPLGCLISDRDGTVNNYCGRYLSSIQSAYNAVFLSRFAERAARESLLLTSAPLSGGGLEDLTVSPPGIFVLAGSKGREYLDRGGRRTGSRRTGGRRGALAIEADKQKMLELLNRRLAELLRDPRYELFGLIGSGLQFKFGQTTIARQDIYGSIPEADSEGFAGVIHELIGEIDPDRLYFRTEDTGKDIEIILTVEGETGLRDFDKGDGILYLDSQLGLGLDRGATLVCGDTSSDIPMVAAAMSRSPDLWTIFVTEKDALKQAVRDTCERAHFVSEPDILVCLLNHLGKEER